MDDTSQFMEWAMDTLLDPEDLMAPAAAVGDVCGEAMFPSLQALREASQAAEMVQELMAEDHVANSSSSGDSSNTDGGGNVPLPVPAPAALSPTTTTRRARRPPSSGANVLPAVSWDFSTGATQPGTKGGVIEQVVAAPRSLPDEQVPGGSPPPAKRASAPSSSYAPDHIIAERKRRERINKRIIELSTVIPGLKKMDKATILTDAARYVKELQERLKAMEEQAAGGTAGRSIADTDTDTVVPVKKPCIAPPEENGSSSSSSSVSSEAPPAAATKPLPEIEARFSEKTAMMRIHCDGGKGMAVRALGEVERLGLAIVHANVMPFSASTLIITITAKMDEGFTVTTEEIVSTLNSALSKQHSNCNNGAEETGH